MVIILLLLKLRIISCENTLTKKWTVIHNLFIKVLFSSVDTSLMWSNTSWSDIAKCSEVIYEVRQLVKEYEINMQHLVEELKEHNRQVLEQLPYNEHGGQDMLLLRTLRLQPLWKIQVNEESQTFSMCYVEQPH